VIEDKLTRDERIRLEALNQAVVASTGHIHGDSVIISMAEVFEAFIRNGKLLGAGTTSMLE